MFVVMLLLLLYVNSQKQQNWCHLPINCWVELNRNLLSGIMYIDYYVEVIALNLQDFMYFELLYMLALLRRLVCVNTFNVKKGV